MYSCAVETIFEPRFLLSKSFNKKIDGLNQGLMLITECSDADQRALSASRRPPPSLASRIPFQRRACAGRSGENVYSRRKDHWRIVPWRGRWFSKRRQEDGRRVGSSETPRFKTPRPPEPVRNAVCKRGATGLSAGFPLRRPFEKALRAPNECAPLSARGLVAIASRLGLHAHPLERNTPRRSSLHAGVGKN